MREVAVWLKERGSGRLACRKLRCHSIHDPPDPGSAPPHVCPGEDEEDLDGVSRCGSFTSGHRGDSLRRNDLGRLGRQVSARELRAQGKAVEMGY